MNIPQENIELQGVQNNQPRVSFHEYEVNNSVIFRWPANLLSNALFAI